MPDFTATVKVTYFAFVGVTADSKLDADKAAEEVVKRAAPHEIDCDGNNTERDDVEVINVQEVD